MIDFLVKSTEATDNNKVAHLLMLSCLLFEHNSKRSNNDISHQFYITTESYKIVNIILSSKDISTQFLDLVITFDFNFINNIIW
jgi:hypothetical protein